MKWHRGSEYRRARYHAGPVAHYWTARDGGARYEVRAGWARPVERDGGIVWWSHDGDGDNRPWPTEDDAKAWCELRATLRRLTRPRE